MASESGWETIVPSNKAEPTKDTGGWETVSKPAAKDSGIADSFKAGGEAFVRSLPATGGFWAGSAAGAAAVAPIAAPIAPAAPIVAGAIEFAGGLAGGLITSSGVAWATDRLSKLMDPEGYAQWEKTQQEHSTATTVGSFAAGFAGSSYKTAAEQAGKAWTKPIVQRATSGAAMGGLDAVQQAVTTGEVDLKTVAASAVGGALLPGANVAGKVASAIGGATAKAVMPKKEATTSVGDLPPKPPEGATPEERAAYIDKLKEIKADRDAKAPLVEAAIRNKETGEIERMGPKHDQARKDATKDTHEEGFVDDRGNFHERQVAVDQAKRSGQIPKDHVLENPPGEREGLHSGDLRKVGDERFKVSEEQPIGEPKAPVEEQKPYDSAQLTTRDDYKSAITKNEDQRIQLELLAEEAASRGDEVGVTSINEQIKTLEAEHSQLHQDIPQVKFADPSKPTWEELHEHLWQAKTVGEAFDRLSSLKELGKTKQLLLKALNQSEFIRNAKLELSNELLTYTDANGVEKNDAAGLYHSDGHKVHKVQLGKTGDVRVLLHEAMHAGTQRLLDAGNTSAAQELQRLYTEFTDHQKAKYQQALDAALKEHGALTPKEYTDLQNKHLHYGLTNVHEFVAEAFTNKKFQSMLKEIKTGERQKGTNSVWGKFVEAVREGLNIPEGARTALDDVMEHGISVVKKSKDFTAGEDLSSSLPSKLAESTSDAVAEESKIVDPRSIPNEEQFYKHATDIYERYGEDEAIKFFEAYKQNFNERSVPVPNNNQQLDDALHRINTYETKDRSEHVIGYENNTKNGVTSEDRAKWFDMRERGEELPPEAKAILNDLDAENIALVRKAKGMGLEVGAEFTSGQSRIRLFSEKEKPGWKDTIKKFFSNDTPMGDKVADQANAAIERKVYQLDDGRVIEFHRQPEDTKVLYKDEKGQTKYRDVKKGTEIWEWVDGKKQLIAHSPDLQLKVGDKIPVNKFSKSLSEGPEVGTASERRKMKLEPTIVDGKVTDIEKHSPYRYLHDAEASARIANMGLRKMVREAEFVENLKKSEMFKQVGHSPEQDLKDLPKGWVVPSNIDRIPQLRGWHFDPKTAAIIEDFAKVWDNSMWMNMTNALVKNMMLNPIPHMFNEVMHVWNARGFTGWVSPGRLGDLASSGRRAWRDVGNQTQLYRDVMREGGSLLGADPRNKGYFDTIVKQAQKDMFGTPEMERNMKGMAKKLGTTVGDLYNSIGEASQKAMWFTRDVMYMQLIHENMMNHEKRTGQKMELKDAIYEVERHMPNYRLPSEVMGSRSLSKVLRNPNVSMFSRYHYGMVKSLVNTVKDINPQNLKTPEGRQHFREGVDTMLAIGVAMGALYPLMDMIAESMFGEGAQQRRAGPYHLIEAAEKVATGEKDASALIWPVFTFNPMLLSLGQLAFNKKIFSGKQIYHPDDSIGEIASDVGEYGVKQIPQASPLISATTEDEGGGKLLARQLDIKAKSQKDLEREARAKKYQERTKKGRDTKRTKGTYTP
jgi:hypothetical protein